MTSERSRTGDYSSISASELAYTQLSHRMRELGVETIYVKALSPNDNSKNQIYLSASFRAINMIPVVSMVLHEPSSRKNTLKSGAKLVQGQINFSWITPSGHEIPAPNSKLILYPQYPEVRLSGFLKGSNIDASEWFDVKKSGRAMGRYLLIGVTSSQKCFGFLAPPNSRIANELAEAGYIASVDRPSVLQEVHIGDNQDPSRSALLRELARIHRNSPIKGKILSAGNLRAYNALNGGGYTLEAELGIDANGIAEPDYKGWEIKGYSRNVLTLMTPEPDGGEYREKGVEWFVRQYGYPDRMGRSDRFNFGGVHRINEPGSRTGLSLKLAGYDGTPKSLDLSGSIQLIAADGVVASQWSYIKLLEHWNKKHAQAAYVPYSAIRGEHIEYEYGNIVALGIGTDFYRMLDAFRGSNIYYDPGIKLENASSENSSTKRRSQFRIKLRDLHLLYESWKEVDVLHPDRYV